MKEASGELNMTVVTIVAIGAILTFFTVFIFPQIKNTITNTWDNTTNTSGNLDGSARN